MLLRLSAHLLLDVRGLSLTQVQRCPRRFARHWHQLCICERKAQQTDDETCRTFRALFRTCS